MFNKKIDFLTMQDAFKEGKNITELLRKHFNVLHNTPEIIEMAYDLQAGTYIEYLENYPKIINLYVEEMAKIISARVPYSSVVLDVGSGELTTLSLLINCLKIKPKKVLAFDISWSRVSKGLIFAKETLGGDFGILDAFCAETESIPLPSKSVDFAITSHSLEPNGEFISNLLNEIFRVTRKTVFLFEPCYEIASKVGQERMDKFGYVKNIAQTAEGLGALVVEIIPILNSLDPLNPTACFVIQPPGVADYEVPERSFNSAFTVPGTNFPLENIENFYFSEQTGVSYPIILSIPILKLSAGVLTSALIRKKPAI
jgi:SAM-dependent methyltransferase